MDRSLLVSNLMFREKYYQLSVTCNKFYRDHGKACGLGNISVPFGYVTTCKQTYVTRVLLAMDKSNRTVPQSFRFPTNCCCHIEADLDGKIAG